MRHVAVPVALLALASLALAGPPLVRTMKAEEVADAFVFHDALVDEYLLSKVVEVTGQVRG